jgi:hypothetical protein
MSEPQNLHFHLQLFRDHVSLTTNDTSYWSFSFDEMGKYDLPAAFDYILNLTSSKDLTYIGHSMGTVMFWVSMHQVQKFKCMQLLMKKDKNYPGNRDSQHCFFSWRTT